MFNKNLGIPMGSLERRSDAPVSASFACVQLCASAAICRILEAVSKPSCACQGCRDVGSRLFDGGVLLLSGEVCAYMYTYMCIYIYVCIAATTTQVIVIVTIVEHSNRNNDGNTNHQNHDHNHHHHHHHHDHHHKKQKTTQQCTSY